MAFTVNSSGIVGFQTNEAGHITTGRINSVPSAGLDTTTLTYAAGCDIVDSSSGLHWFNIGTSVAPAWIVGAPDGVQQTFTVAAGQIPLMFGGTSIQLLPAPPLGTAQAYAVTGMVLEYVGAGGTGFTAGGSTVRVVYGSAGTNVATYMNLGTSTFFGTATKILQGAYIPASSGQTVVAGMGLYLDNTGAAYATAGTSSLKVTLWYSIIPIA